MARLFWDSGTVRGHGQGDFEPDQYQEFLDRLSALTSVPLRFVNEQAEPQTAPVCSPVRLGARRTGWAVAAQGDLPSARRAAETAAEVVSRLFTADQDIGSLAMEMADRYEELNFLYEMSGRVGALLDENRICAFVVEEAAWLLNCERASIMVADPDTGELKIRAAVGLPEDISDDVTVRPGERISGKVFESGHGIIVNAGDPMPADSLNVSELKESNCFLSVPLKISSPTGEQGRVLGVFNLTRKRGGSMFTASDQKLVSAVAATTATQIHNCRLINAERQRQHLEHELELAARIQLRLLPEGPLCAGPVEAGGLSRPARHVGGDLFDYWIQDGRICLVVGDVSGHDIGAALMATAFRSVMRSTAVQRRSVTELMALVNGALLADLVNAELFVSAFYAEVELESGIMTFCRAGHPKPLLLRSDGEEWLDTEGSLLGIAEDGAFGERSIRLRPGDTVLLYTDGLLEALDSDNRSFGSEGVRRAAREHIACPPQQMAERVIEAARAHSGSAPLLDDMTALAARLKGARERR
jgi:serine phosphatase RsbU (regulator of sigma subunit)